MQVKGLQAELRRTPLSLALGQQPPLQGQDNDMSHTLASPEDSESRNPDVFPLNKPPLLKIGKKMYRHLIIQNQTPDSKHSLFFSSPKEMSQIIQRP